MELLNSVNSAWSLNSEVEEEKMPDLEAPPKRRTSIVRFTSEVKRTLSSRDVADRRVMRAKSAFVLDETSPLTQKEDTVSPLTSIKKKKTPFLRKTMSLLADVEDDTTSHEHCVIAPKESVTTKKLENGSSQTKREAYGYLIAVLVLSCAYFKTVAGWTLVDAVYFTIVTLTTVGYGDQVPQTKPDKLFAIFLFFFGAGVVGNLVGATFAGYVEEQKNEETLAKAQMTALQQEKLKLLKQGRDDEAIDKEIAEILAKRRALRDPHRRLKRNFLLLVCWTFGGALWFSLLEPKVDFLDAVYWSGASLTTVGFGDVHVTKEASKIFAIFFLLGGTFVCLKALGSIAAIPIEAHRLQVEARVLSQYGDTLKHQDFLELTRGELVSSFGILDDAPASMTKNGRAGGRRCSKAAFALAMLVKIGRVEIEDVQEAFYHFDRLDHNNHGYICLDDVVEHDDQRSTAASIPEDDDDEFRASSPLAARTINVDTLFSATIHDTDSDVKSPRRLTAPKLKKTLPPRRASIATATSSEKRPSSDSAKRNWRTAAVKATAASRLRAASLFSSPQRPQDDVVLN